MRNITSTLNDSVSSVGSAPEYYRQPEQHESFRNQTLLHTISGIGRANDDLRQHLHLLQQNLFQKTQEITTLQTQLAAAHAEIFNLKHIISQFQAAQATWAATLYRNKNKSKSNKK